MLKKGLFLFIILGFSTLVAEGAPDFVRNRIVSFLASEGSLDKSKIDLKILHCRTKNNLNKYSSKEIQVRNKNDQILGHNTIWLKIRGENTTLEKFPVTYTASANISAVIAIRKIKYNANISEKNIEIQEEYVSRNLNEYYRSVESIPDNYTSTQLIREGEPIKKSLLRQKSLIDRGETINARIIKKGIEVKAQARARERGKKGEEIGVFIESTRQRMTGIVSNKNSVIIKVR